MDIQKLIEKLRTEEITSEEEDKIVATVISELDVLRDDEPKRYLALLKSLNEALESIDTLLQKGKK